MMKQTTTPTPVGQRRLLVVAIAAAVPLVLYLILLEGIGPRTSTDSPDDCAEIFELWYDQHVCLSSSSFCSWYRNEPMVVGPTYSSTEEDGDSENDNETHDDVDEVKDEDESLYYYKEEEWIYLVSPEEDVQLDLPTDVAATYFPYEEQPNWLLPNNLEAGEVEEIRWRDTGEIIADDEVFAVGLPHGLLDEFQSYFEEETGIVDLVHRLLYNNSEDGVSYDEEEAQLWTVNDGHKWSVKRADHWNTDMVWFDPADEACYERLRSILRRGQFDTVLQAIADRLKQPALRVHGVGAIFLSRFKGFVMEHLHRDVPMTRGAFYNILVPIYLPTPDQGEASLYIGGVDHLCAPINLKHHVATVIGSDSWHGTGDCDYTAHQGFRLSMSIWASEINETSLETIATDGLSPWPLHDDKVWYRAQAHRNLTNDTGRTSPFHVRDTREDCESFRDKCDSDLLGIRTECAKTCQVYMADEEYQTFLKELKAQEERDHPSIEVF